MKASYHNKRELRFHKRIENKVVSVFIREDVFNKDYAYTDKDNMISTNWYGFIGACVSKSKRFNNDWWSGDSKGNNVMNISTGTAITFMCIIDIVIQYVMSNIQENGWCFLMLDGTDDRRMMTYIKSVNHICKKKNLILDTIATDKGLLCRIQ